MADKRYILTQEQINAYVKWLDDSGWNAVNLDREEFERWVFENPCPLPSPVEIPNDDEIDKHYEYYDEAADMIMSYDASEGAKWLRNLILK